MDRRSRPESPSTPLSRDDLLKKSLWSSWCFSFDSTGRGSPGLREMPGLGNAKSIVLRIHLHPPSASALGGALYCVSPTCIDVSVQQSPSNTEH